MAKGDRVIIYMPMVPEAVIAMLACARIGAIHSVVFGGFAAPELATRIDDCQAGGHPVGLLRHRARPRRALQAAARRGHRARQRTSRRSVLMLQRPMSEASMIAGRDHDWERRGRRRQGARPQGRVRLGARHRPALHPLHVGHHRPAQGRDPRQRRAHGGAQVDHEEPLRRGPRRDLLGRFRRRLGGWSLLHLLRAAAARLHDRSSSRASRSARPTPAPSGASSPSTASPPCSPRPPPSAPSRRRTPRASTSPATTCAPSARCSWPASAPTPRPSSGPRPT